MEKRPGSRYRPRQGDAVHGVSWELLQEMRLVRLEPRTVTWCRGGHCECSASRQSQTGAFQGQPCKGIPQTEARYRETLASDVAGWG